MKIKTSYVPTAVTYLTVDKEYEVVSFVNNCGGFVRDDAGDTLLICFAKCAHLNDCAWEIIND